MVSYLYNNIIQPNKVLRLGDLASLLHLLIRQVLAKIFNQKQVALNRYLQAQVGQVGVEVMLVAYLPFHLLSTDCSFKHLFKRSGSINMIWNCS